MKLNEVFDSKPEPITWKTKSKRKWVGEFNVEDIPYRLFFNSGMGSQGKDVWELTFSIDKKGRLPADLKDKIQGTKNFGVVGTGNQGKVFSTVMAALKELIKSVSPKQLQFSAEEPSRMKLYKRMVSKFASSLGYKPEMTGDYFELVRKD
jgi:hypothetical protein